MSSEAQLIANYWVQRMLHVDAALPDSFMKPPRWWLQWALAGNSHRLRTSLEIL